MAGITGLSAEDVAALAKLHPDAIMEQLRRTPSGRFRYAAPEVMQRLARLVGKRRWSELWQPMAEAFAAVTTTTAMRDTSAGLRRQALASERARARRRLDALRVTREEIRQALAPLLALTVARLDDAEALAPESEPLDRPAPDADPPPSRLLVSIVVAAPNAPSRPLEPAA